MKIGDEVWVGGKIVSVNRAEGHAIASVEVSLGVFENRALFKAESIRMVEPGDPQFLENADILQTLQIYAPNAVKLIGLQTLSQITETLNTFIVPKPSRILRCLESHVEGGQCELRQGHRGKHLGGMLMWEAVANGDSKSEGT